MRKEWNNVFSNITQTLTLYKLNLKQILILTDGKRTMLSLISNERWIMKEEDFIFSNAQILNINKK